MVLVFAARPPARAPSQTMWRTWCTPYCWNELHLLVRNANTQHLIYLSGIDGRAAVSMTYYKIHTNGSSRDSTAVMTRFAARIP